MNLHLNLNLNFWCLTPLSAIFQLYHGDFMKILNITDNDYKTLCLRAFIDTAIALLKFKLSFIFGIVHVCCLFVWKSICVGFLIFAYICIAVGDPIIKRGALGFH